MRRVPLGGSRGMLAGVAAVLPLLVLTSACSNRGERRVVAPEPLPDAPQVTGARWVWEPGALAGAVQAAGRNPLVQRALVGAPAAGLRSRYDLAVRAVGDDASGGTVGLTILPYAVDGDPTRAAFITLAQGYGAEGAEFAEMIVGRDPRPDEVGYQAAAWGHQVVWIRTGDAYFPATAGAQRAPLKRQWTKLFDCMSQRMPTGCAEGAAIANELAPGEPRAAAIGCGVGAAAGAISCAVDWLRDR